MRPEVEVRCGLCFFWSGSEGQGSGHCHRFPPMPAGVIQARNSVLEPDKIVPAIVSGFPEVGANLWCGEFQPAAVAKKLDG